MTRNLLMASNYILLIVTLLSAQPKICAAGIDESIRLTPDVLRALDFIDPNTSLVFREKKGQILVFTGYDINGNMSLHGINESYKKVWSWTPRSPGLFFIELFNIKLTDDGRGGECLVMNKESPFEVFRYSFQNGRTIDSAIIPLPKPEYERILGMDSREGLIACITGFVTTIDNRPTDSLYVYVLDTANARHLRWPLPVTDSIESVDQVSIRMVDTMVCVYWLECVSGNTFRNRFAVFGTYSGELLRSTVLRDVSPTRYLARKIVVDQPARTVSIVARAVSLNKTQYGLRYWKIDLEEGTVDSTEDYLPEYTYLNAYDAIVTEDKRVIGVGSIWDVYQETGQLIDQSARGCMFEYAPDGTLKRFFSMQDQRPTRLTSVFVDQQSMFVCGINENSTPFIAKVDESCISSITNDSQSQHLPLQHVAWYSIVGEYLERPTTGTFVEVYQCTDGCCHTSLNNFVNGERIGLGGGK